MTISEEEGKLIRKVELTEEEIRAEIESEEESIKETLDKIDMYKTYLPVEKMTEEESEDDDNVEETTETTPNY
jgi:hypothetical protein